MRFLQCPELPTETIRISRDLERRRALIALMANAKPDADDALRSHRLTQPSDPDGARSFVRSCQDVFIGSLRSAKTW